MYQLVCVSLGVCLCRYYVHMHACTDCHSVQNTEFVQPTYITMVGFHEVPSMKLYIFTYEELSVFNKIQ